jgi:formamidopyrimidine-DNA glycosylase
VPELPEVEHARRCLQRWLGGATIVAVKVLDPRIVKRGRASRVAELVGRRVLRVERRGKWLRLPLLQTEGEGVVFSHLGMTGKWVVSTEDAPVRFEKIRLDVKKGRTTRSVRYLDPRLFGAFIVATEDIPAWRGLGPDPLHDRIDALALHAKLARKALPIKPALLDQELLAGVGNIQATEALFMAKLDPWRPSKSLTVAEVRALAKAIHDSIERTLKLQEAEQRKDGGITYVEEPGSDNPFLVYGRAGEKCPRCKKTTLKKMTQAGRTTTYCPHCQHVR